MLNPELLKKVPKVCSRAKCQGPAKYVAVLLLRVHNGHAPAEAVLYELPHCELHKHYHDTAPKLLRELGWDFWNTLVARIQKAGKRAPRRELTSIRWEEIPVEEVKN